MKRQGSFRIAIRKFGPFESAIQKQWTSFESIAHTGLSLEAEPFDLHPLQESLFAQQGLVRGDWDIAFINTDWVSSIHSSGAVVDLSSYLLFNPPEGYPHGWSDSLLQLQKIDGSIVGFPYHDGPECFIYRKDLFDNPQEKAEYKKRYGISLNPPRTWQEFWQIAHFFHRPQEKLYGTAFAAFPDGHNTVYDFLLQLWTRGGDLFDQSGKICFNTPEAIEALTFYRAVLQDQAAVHPACRKMDSVQLGLAFAAGEVAMMVNWFGFATMAETMENTNVRGRVGIANIPHGEKGTSTSLNIYWMLSIAAGSLHSDIAYKFLRHCASAEMDRLLTLEGGTGCRKSTWNDAAVNQIAPFYRQLEGFHSTARGLPRLTQWPQAASIIDDLIVSAIETKRQISELLKNADEKIATIFSQDDNATL
ncbi:MAG TPA: extracellular solute-binding protein [Acidobacteriaceae bacterium]|jgi:multiple sugar transport system substrate-binding protein|nr:extracellular solute-binding protein [Acidobacteriaceae bacterium]